jgi:excisionase family DNA binding protein
MTDRLTYTVEEAADLMGLSRSGAYRGVRRGEIPCIRIGRRLLVPKSALETYVADVENPMRPLPTVRQRVPIAEETAWDAALRRSSAAREAEAGSTRARAPR